MHSGGGAHLLERRYIEVAQHGPQEADQLAGDGGGRYLAGLLGGQAEECSLGTRPT
jgi:hypothetical protein